MSHSDYELGVNGSAVTLFADPENAISVNEGVTLIPWMGDSSNLIDRSAISLNFLHFLTQGRQIRSIF
jgi:hypothetical protein